MTFLRQSIVILLALSLTVLLKSVFFNVTVPILGIMILFYTVLARRKKFEDLNLFTLTSFVLILVVSTGEISSPLFFLLYFLTFGIGVLFDPKVVFVLTISLIVLLFPSALETDVFKNLILLFSFTPLSALAFFTGKAYQENQRLKIKNQKKVKKNKSRVILHFGLIGLLGYLLIGLFLPTSSAQTMSNENYIIQTEGLNTSSGISEGSDFKINPNVGNLSPITSEGVNYKIKTGFEAALPSLPFSISLSSDIIDFGTLSPTNPIIRTVDLSIGSPSVYGYSVIVFENQALTTIPPASKTFIQHLSETTHELNTPSEKGAGFIPDTTCDNGRCNAQSAAQWANTLTYGFGYRCDDVTGIDCDREFKNPNFYKPFPNIEKDHSLQSIMAGIGGNNKEARISYKVNISGTQTEGIYTNVVTFIAVPNF